jgi:hypothetical protein
VRAATVERPSPVDDERFATVRYRPPERDEHRGGGEVRIAGDEPAGDIGVKPGEERGAIADHDGPARRPIGPGQLFYDLNLRRWVEFQAT